MNIPAWTKPALYGAATGAVALAIIGFTWGGWVTGGSAQEAAAKLSASNLATALTPYCVERSKSDPQAGVVLAEFTAASAFSRRGIIEKSGWATPLGAEAPNKVLAEACALALTPA
ncbi:hypothetical protein [Devosia sp. A449]